MFYLSQFYIECFLPVEEVVVAPGGAQVADTRGETSTDLKAETTVEADASTEVNVKTATSLEAGIEAKTSTKVTNQAREESGLGSANEASKGRNDSVRTHCSRGSNE